MLNARGNSIDFENWLKQYNLSWGAPLLKKNKGQQRLRP